MGGIFITKKTVEITGIDTSKLKVLNNYEMIDLFKKYKSGDKSVKNTLVEGNLKLVLSVISKFKSRVENMDDLFQVGCVGLIKAIDNFDLSYNVKFSTYAVPLILGECKRSIRDDNSLRISRSIKDQASKILIKKEQLTKEKNKEPSNDEILKELDISFYEYGLAVDSLKPVMSMNEPIYNDGGDAIYLEDQIGTLENYSKEDLIALKDSLNKLKEKEKYVLLERYIVGKTQNELAEELNISQAQVSRLEKSGIENIKRLIL